MFSLEQLLFSVAADSRTNNEILERIMPMIVEVYDRELTDRKKIKVCRTHKLDTLSDEHSLTKLLFAGCWCQTNRETCDQEQATAHGRERM